ncbi:MAG TPA: multicopper oxidase domain-containing protein, partial [Burkholderiales bacterium]|nr:multicopper oxidase domain-containing protein [Burkholderiales bacterium]
AAPPLPPDAAFPYPLRVPGEEGLYGVAEVSGALALTAKAVQHELLPGRPARLLAYELEHQGKVLRNPVLRVRTGARLRAKFWNALGEPSIIHWHGLKVDSNNDGHPHYAVAAGATYDYQFLVANRAATYWYHAHPHGATGRQIYLGLAGLLIVEDEEELALRKALDLGFGATDIPLVLQDLRLDSGGQPIFAPDATERFHGHFGGEVVVNLTPRPHLDVETRLYRFRVLNASNARLYRLAFRRGTRLLDYHVIGTDGGLLDRPRAVEEAFVSPGERLDLLLDLRAARPGDEVVVASLPFDAMHLETGGGAGHGAQHAASAPVLPDGAELALLKLRVARRIAYDRPLPQTLSRLEPVAESTASPRLVALDQAGRMTWRINAATYEQAATPIAVRRGSVEHWDLRNIAPSMPHPVHLHGFPFRVLAREASPAQQRRLAVDQNGLAASDLGWKDTVLVWPGETVRIAVDFTHPFPGDQVYLVHCHNLEHEDGGMMLNVRVAG